MRPKRRAPGLGISDVLIAGTATSWSMAAMLVVAALMDGVIAGDAGSSLALIFAGLLAAGGLLLLLAGIGGLSPDERTQGDHYLVPVMTGVAAGVFTTMLIISAQPGSVMLLPLILLVFAIRPIRVGLAHLYKQLTGQGR